MRRNRTRPWPTALGLSAAILATGPLAFADEGKSGAEATALPPSSEKLSIPYEKYTLPNGLEVILHEDHRTPFVAVSVWYHVGAFHESPGRTGFAHLFEHLMFQGSQNVGDDNHIAYLEQAGASIRKGMVNGTTNFDRTNYFEVLPKSELELALWLESDRMGWLDISDAKLDEQRKVVKNERLQSLENVPYGLADEKLWHAVFPEDHPYFGQIIGSLADLDAATLDDVRGFYDTYYAPSNATLTIAGDIDVAKTKEIVEKYFGTLSPWDKPKPREVKRPSIDKPIRIDFEEPIAKLPKVTFTWLTPALFADGDAEMDVLAHVLSSGKSSRLQRALLFDERLAQSVNAYQYSMQNVSVFGIEVVVKDGVNPEDVVSALEAQLELLGDLPPEPAEIERAVNAIETQRLFGLQKIGGFSGKAEQLQSYNHFLGEPDWLANDLARYRKITPDSLAKAIKAELDPNKRAVLVAVPKKATADAGNDDPKATETAKTDAAKNGRGS